MNDSIASKSDLDDIDDMEMIMQQLRYEQLLQEQEAKSSNGRNSSTECFEALTVCIVNGKFFRKNDTGNLRELDPNEELELLIIPFALRGLGSMVVKPGAMVSALPFLWRTTPPLAP
ncbi:hypothetical protein Tco_1228046 [Tanacetum coccineum]